MATSLTIDQLKFEHQEHLPKAERLRDTVVTQLLELFQEHNLTLGVPIEGRVKSWSSIEEKLSRKPREIPAIHSLGDLIGVRAIFLFHDDLNKALEIIPNHFEVCSTENTFNRLAATEFGYQSQHLSIKLPEKWLSVPTLKGLSDFVVELQLRTLAQHMWAAASHKLQYKMESAVPPPVRRSIHRVSALLETVDLEFGRLLEQRRSYKESEAAQESDDSTMLNVDSLAAVLDELLPPQNKGIDEKYAGLLADLLRCGITTSGELRSILQTHLPNVLELERANIAEAKKPGTLNDTMSSRADRGIFYTHTGLVRVAVRFHLGADVANSHFQILPQEYKKKRKSSG